MEVLQRCLCWLAECASACPPPAPAGITSPVKDGLTEAEFPEKNNLRNPVCGPDQQVEVLKGEPVV